MSSSEDSDAGPKRKRKVRRLDDSPGSPIIGNSSSSRIIRRQQAVILSSSDSDSSPILTNRKRKIMRVSTDSNIENSDDSDIGQHRPINPRRLQSDSDNDSSTSQWESDFSDLEDETQPKNGMQITKNDSESELSDGQSEKCPICLVSFKNQEIGTPEACDHMFCLDCIQEWSKNVNTCPVDRQEYSLILVRANLNGKVIRQIPIERPVPQNEVDIFEDPTFCEICGSNDHEDRMLLCDGCDLGFHLYCLNPPLNDVPTGSWYCESCSSNSETEYSYDLQYLFQEHEENIDRSFRPSRSNRSSRIIPRTRQTERVRRRIANNRQQSTPQNRAQGNLTENSTVTSTSRRRKRRKRKTKYRTVYEIDPVTGLSVAVQKRAKKRRKPRNEREMSKPKSVKKRLAKQLGMCGPRNAPQNLPDVKVVDRPVTASGTINSIRHSAGIPTLDLFGQNNDLDYFTEEEEEDFGMGLQILVRRAPNRSDASVMRRTIRRKNLVMPEAVSSTSDLLDSILTSQEQLYAKNASYSIDPTGKFKIDAKNKSRIDLNKEKANAKETPYYNPNRRYGNNQNYNRSYQNRQQRPSNNYYHSNNQSFYHNEPSSSMNYSNYGNDNNDYPQDYSNRTLSGNSETENRNDDEEEEEERDESELDIYSDIETVTTTKAEESSEYRPLSPPPMPTLPLLGFDDDNNDSEPDMVIDDEKVQEQEYNKEETAVTSTVGFSQDFEPEPVTTESGEIQSEAVQSSSLDNIKTYDYYNDDSLDGCPNTSIYSKEAAKPVIEEDIMESDDECPNFSIYSKESKTMALHTDLSLSSEKNIVDYHQVGEISSSPNFEIDRSTENNPVSVPDPDQMYDPEETFNETEEQTESVEQMYDPERDSATPTLEHTYDPENCLRTDESLATVAEKTLDPDQSYDPENVFEENSDSVDKNIDIEKEIYNFKDESNVEGRYDPAVPFSDDLEESMQVEETKDEPKKKKKNKSSNLLYSDSEDDENVVKKDKNTFAVTDINNMTEDISEEERSYTPCLDEKSQKQGLEGLDTEMISDEERNDFDESHDLKTVSDGDALEINAKESELDFTRPEDYEEGEIVDKTKDKESINEEVEMEKDADKTEVPTEIKKSKKKEKASEPDRGGNKENEEANKEASFKKLSKSSKDRNYRDKERRPSSRNRSNDRDSRREKKKEKRKELERYNVRAIIAEKPRPLIAKDQFGRDIRTTPSRSRSRSYTPPIRSGSRPPVRSPSKPRSRSRTRRSISRRRSISKEKQRKRRKSRNYKSLSRSRSPIKKGQKGKKRKRSTSRFRKRKIDDKPKNKRRPRSGRRSRTASPLRRPRDRERIDWTPRSQPHAASPSWTPPRLIDNAQLLRTESLTVTVNNSKKKKDKKKKSDRRNKDTLEGRAKKRRHERERTPPPSKEVFASGDNILVSVSFNNENETRDITTRDKRKHDEAAAAAAAAKKRKKRKNKKDLTGVKPVAIIDLDKSPFRELTPSPKQIIVLTDSENEDNAVQANICDSSQQVASPERLIGPKTPPEPQVKFSLAPKAPQIRAINNPLIDPDDIETSVTNDIVSRMSPGHKGPSTPQEPPNSPPSSPDAYDPFEPTKSRSPTPDLQVQSNQDGHESIDSRAAIDLLEKSMNPMPENNAKSLTPPLADIQPADSQSSVQVVTPDSNIDKSPDRPTQIQSVQQTVKPVAQTIPFSSVPTTLNTSTPLSVTLPPSRINILNATVITPPVASPIPQRIVLPNLIKSVKIPPTKSAIKSTPIKPMPAKTNKIVIRKRTQNGSSDDNILLDFDSPYSPGSSDYEDLFDPPSEIVTKPMIKGKNKSPMKHASAFDVLFGSPSYNPKGGKKKFGKKSSIKTKTVGVRLDEENLKILDDLPNSAVEMQVKDKFLKKLNRQERVVEEVKLVLKPYYNKKKINKEEYKDIMRRSVPKICHNKSGEINPSKIKNLIEAYVRKVRHSKKVTSSSSVNPLKI